MKDLVENITKLNELLDAFGKHQVKKRNGTPLNMLERMCNDLGVRIRVNLEASKRLIDLINQNYSFSLPVGLIFRSIISDILTFCYCLRFYDFDSDPDKQPSLKNELDLLDRDLISSILYSIKKEREVAKLNDKLKDSKTDDEIEQLLGTLRTQFNHLFINKELKTAKAMRRTSLDGFFRTLRDRENPPGRSMISESYKYERIMEESFFKSFAPIISAFKYYSQFHHFAPFSYYTLKEEKRNLFYLFLTIDFIYMTYIMYIQLFEKDDKEWEDKILQLRSEIELIIKRSPV
jgi:hypothetical protein